MLLSSENDFDILLVKSSTFLSKYQYGRAGLFLVAIIQLISSNEVFYYFKCYLSLFILISCRLFMIQMSKMTLWRWYSVFDLSFLTGEPPKGRSPFGSIT